MCTFAIAHFLQTSRSIAANTDGSIEDHSSKMKTRKANVSYIMLANRVTFLRLKKLRHYFAFIFQRSTRHTKVCDVEAKKTQVSFYGLNGALKFV